MNNNNDNNNLHEYEQEMNDNKNNDNYNEHIPYKSQICTSITCCECNQTSFPSHTYTGFSYPPIA